MPLVVQTPGACIWAAAQTPLSPAASCCDVKAADHVVRRAPMGSVVVLATKAEHMNGYYSVLKCEHNIGGYSAKYNNTIHVFTILFFSIKLEREKND